MMTRVTGPQGVRENVAPETLTPRHHLRPQARSEYSPRHREPSEHSPDPHEPSIGDTRLRDHGQRQEGQEAERGR